MAIISSSLVGMSRTLTLESVGGDHALLAADVVGVRVHLHAHDTPGRTRCCIRSSASFSPTPAVKMMASTPPMAAAYAPMSFLTLVGELLTGERAALVALLSALLQIAEVGGNAGDALHAGLLVEDVQHLADGQ